MSALNRRADDDILEYYDRCLQAHGDTAQGAAWPNELDRRKRFQVMLEVIKERGNSPLVLCDVGCGTGELLTYIKEQRLTHIKYIGADRSRLALNYARRKHPEATFIEIDILASDANLTDLAADYVVASGLFTVKCDLSAEQMHAFWTEVVAKIWTFARRGVAFNLMSSVVDWEREDLFHVSMDEAARFLHGLAGRNIVLRADYQLYEYTAYAYKAVAGNARDDSDISVAKVDARAPVPVLRPLTAARDLIAPYIDMIDARKIYSNYGPLLFQLSDRLSAQFGLPPRSVVGASSGTTALTAAILSAAGRATAKRPIAVVPSFTFIATALAVEQCGFDLLILDVDAETWMLSPEIVRLHPDLNRIGLVVPVAPFGRPVPQEPWLAFHRDTNVPVVIDAAACFEAFIRGDQQDVGLVPTVLSFHATKSYSTGEGGAVLSKHSSAVISAAQVLNFGFHDDRLCHGPGLNGKMSEYHAAIGLAELDAWPMKAAALGAVVSTYERAFEMRGLAPRLIRSPDISSCYMIFSCRSAAEAAQVRADLKEDGIEYRAWYGAGLHSHPYFRHRRRHELRITEDLGEKISWAASGTVALREPSRTRRIGGDAERPGLSDVKTVAIMQPYFIPYAGYFRLFALADEVVILDDVQFPRRGYVHRNRLIRHDDSLDWLTLPLKYAPTDTTIGDLRFRSRPMDELSQRLKRSRAASTSGIGSALLMSAIRSVNDRTPVDFTVELLAAYCGALRLPFADLRASALGLPAGLKGQDRIIAISKKRQASTYLNLSGGRTLYDRQAFRAEGLNIRFLKPYTGPINSICDRLNGSTAEQLRSEIVDQSVCTAD